jgi:homoserine dehydrogenase
MEPLASTPLRLGIAGLGTVGAGVMKLLSQNAALITARAGRPIEVGAVSARDRRLDRGIALDGLHWLDDPLALAADPSVDVVVELIGGANGAARALAEAAINNGKPLVTANKALIAEHGASLARLAEAHGVPLGFEAAVAGGMPIIKTLREGLPANRIRRVAGILNGTCNYILTTMRKQKREFADVLAEAQSLGYAEADPSFDVDGIDTAHKLAILAAIAFSRTVDFGAVHVEGIRGVSALDILFAQEFGFEIKLLGIARATEAGIETRVHPAMVPLASPLAHVDGVFNAVVAEGDYVGSIMMQGRGAGGGPTASAVIADIIDIARKRATPMWGQSGLSLSDQPALPMDAHRGAYFIRLMVVDKPGVIADVTSVLRDCGISLESMLQRARSPGEAVPVVLVTHETVEHAMRKACLQLAGLASVLEQPALIRIEPA